MKHRLFSQYDSDSSDRFLRGKGETTTGLVAVLSYVKTERREVTDGGEAVVIAGAAVPHPDNPVSRELGDEEQFGSPGRASGV